MKINIAKAFRKNQRGTIRAALMVAKHHFPMPSRVSVMAMPRSLYDPEMTEEPYDGWAEPNGMIWVCPALRDDALFFTVSHEARHISDFYTGKLTWDGRHCFWRGRKVDGRTGYRNLPYEKVAFAYEARLGSKAHRG